MTHCSTNVQSFSIPILLIQKFWLDEGFALLKSLQETGRQINAIDALDQYGIQIRFKLTSQSAFTRSVDRPSQIERFWMPVFEKFWGVLNENEENLLMKILHWRCAVDDRITESALDHPLLTLADCRIRKLCVNWPGFDNFVHVWRSKIHSQRFLTGLENPKRKA